MLIPEKEGEVDTRAPIFDGV